MDNDCIFCRIVAGELPSTKIYEDTDTVAFMDIAPVVKGHTLVVPKAHTTSIVDTPAETLQKVVAIIQRVADAQIKGLGADGVNVSQANGAVAGQVVPHIHFHVIPRFSDDGHSWNWRHLEYEAPDEMSQVAEKICGAM